MTKCGESRYANISYENFGYDPSIQPPLYLFVVTNSTSQAEMKSGGLQTYKMFSALGHIDLIPNYGTLAQDDFPKKKEKNVTENILIHMKKTGIATHICTLVSYDSPTDDWASVYVHSKLMIVDC